MDFTKQKDFIKDELSKNIKQVINDDMICSNLFEDMSINLDKIKEDIVFINLRTNKIIDIVKDNYNEILTDILGKILEKKIIIFYSLLSNNNENKIKISSNKNNVIKKNNLSFNDIISGEFNNKVLSVLKSIKEKYEVSINPVFIYSNNGLGKSFLLQILNSEINSDENDFRVSKYINAVDFTNKVISLILESNKTKELNKYIDELKEVDLLIIDDIQLFQNKNKPIEKLFEILEYRVNNQKQIIFSSDKKPSNLGGFEDRIISRFEGGISLEIKKPKTKEYQNIVKEKIRLFKWNENNWTNEAIDYIISYNSNSIRSIEGTINKINFMKLKNDQNVVYNEKEVMSLLNENDSKIKTKITINSILEIISKYYQIPKKEIISKSREQKTVLARDIIIWFIRYYLKTPYAHIGEFFGGRKHNAIIASNKRIEEQINKNIQMKDNIALLKLKIEKK